MQYVSVRILKTLEDLDRYESWVLSHPEGNFWQSIDRIKYLENRSKEVLVYIYEKDKSILCSALVVIDKTTLGLSTWDIPRGPIFKSGNEKLAKEVIHRICDDAKKNRCMEITISPPVKIDLPSKFKKSEYLHHAEATIIIDVSKTEEEILTQMKPKGRYNIRVAGKHNVEVDKSEDINLFYDLIEKTSKRDQFTCLPKTSYEAFIKDIPNSFLLVASASTSTDVKTNSNNAIAVLLGAKWNNHQVYYYGASDHSYRACMAPYSLQWEAIKHAKAEGCTSYDLLGIAPPDSVNHPWKGITSFKEKFGGEIKIYPPEMRIRFRPISMLLLSIKRKMF
mgnify:CR=1 FL=1